MITVTGNIASNIAIIASYITGQLGIEFCQVLLFLLLLYYLEDY